MSLVYCPECGHEVSANAVACPNCGLPLTTSPPVVEETVVTTPPVVRRREAIPPWAIVLMGVMGVGLLFALIFLLRGSDEDANVNVALNANRRAANLARSETPTTTTSVPSTDSGTVYVPPSSTDTATMPSTSTSIPSTSAPVSMPPQSVPDKGTVVIKAQLAMPRGQPQPARGVKFYLLDKDIETILSNARVEPIEGNTLSGSLGLAAVFPDRYGDFQRAAMRAIAAHVKYSGSTDSSGTANLKDIKPDSYYLFSITRSGRGFALWDSPVSIVPGQNVLELGAQSVTEISDTTGDDD